MQNRSEQSPNYFPHTSIRRVAKIPNYKTQFPQIPLNHKSRNILYEMQIQMSSTIRQTMWKSDTLENPGSPTRAWTTTSLGTFVQTKTLSDFVFVVISYGIFWASMVHYWLRITN